MGVVKHGGWVAHRRTYQCWSDMKQRCLNPASEPYKNYGGRGISVCERWIYSFEKFLEDMGVKPAGKTLERKDVNGNYTPENCCWATHKEQQGNRRDCRIYTYKGETMCLTEWARKLGIHPATLQTRLRKPGMTFELAATLPHMTRFKASAMEKQK